MKPDDFEKKLQRQSLRKIPGEWRGKILANCRGSNKDRTQEWFWLSPLVTRLSAVFWPHPKAWAALAAIWILIFALNLSTRDHSEIIAKKSAPPSPEVVAELRQQKILFTELIGSGAVREAGPPKFFPRPRTARVEILTA